MKSSKRFTCYKSFLSFSERFVFAFNFNYDVVYLIVQKTIWFGINSRWFIFHERNTYLPLTKLHIHWLNKLVYNSDAILKMKYQYPRWWFSIDAQLKSVNLTKVV